MKSRTLRFLPLVGGLAALLIASSVAIAGSGQSTVAIARQATEKFHDVAAAEAAGYGPFYICTDNESLGAAMGQHYANIDLVLDPAIDPEKPEVLVYEPMPDGSLHLVGVEYVVFQDLWHDAFGPGTPSVLGIDLKPVPAPNRYGLPPFFQRHVWLWKPNPLGMYEDWNSKVSCRGNGDPA
ncbi:MAG TPA: hypothetical protein VFC71_11360 [Candidatus Polarisedimenticolia bacterium]|nr:hypothetical protein [Candidatus Polarisedimenticolia bacterium]